ncbi:hypothetical protein BY458DRAFT_509421 [Sporodiniella umbellata]|nr:hypothetical protein BY458DRAFT_509421 [Sporodiniella umbellata]
MYDPIAPYSDAITTYMKYYKATNLAYILHFTRLDATSATFKNINRSGFRLEYTLANSATGEVGIRFKKALTNPTQVSGVLESMAKEAENALALEPSSFTKSRAKKSGTASSNTPEHAMIPLDFFRWPWIVHIVWVLLFLGGLSIMSDASDTTLGYFSYQAVKWRNATGSLPILILHRLLLLTHVFECLITVKTVIQADIFGPLNIFKWAFSALVFGYTSMKELNKHLRVAQELRSKQE